VPLAHTVRLTNDADLVLTALAGGAGVAVIAGTGSIAVGRNARGTLARAGGWGHIIGDEGSGYTIGRACLQAAARAADGRGPQTLLLDLLMRQWELKHPSDMIDTVYTTEDKARIAQLAMSVFAAARAKDTVARRIIAQAADELHRAAIAVCHALDLARTPLSLALAGGLLVNQPAFRTQVLRRVRRACTLGHVSVVADPALSAARAAVQLDPDATERA
jgi:N-acetylglucosamine kinase-like BadF-type ATPase